MPLYNPSFKLNPHVRGEWVEGTDNYIVDDIVSLNDALWVCIEAHNNAEPANAPGTNGCWIQMKPAMVIPDPVPVLISESGGVESQVELYSQAAIPEGVYAVREWSMPELLIDEKFENPSGYDVLVNPYILGNVYPNASPSTAGVLDGSFGTECLQLGSGAYGEEIFNKITLVDYYTNYPSLRSMTVELDFVQQQDILIVFFSTLFGHSAVAQVPIGHGGVTLNTGFDTYYTSCISGTKYNTRMHIDFDTGERTWVHGNSTVCHDFILPVLPEIVASESSVACGGGNDWGRRVWIDNFKLYSNKVDFYVGDYTTYNGVLYRCIAERHIGDYSSPPGVDTSCWESVVSLSITRTLPDAALNIGEIFYFKKADASAMTINLVPQSGQTIDGDAGYLLELEDEFVQLMAVNATTWAVIGE